MLHLHFQGYCFQGKLLLPEYLCKSQVNNSLINRSKFVYFGMVLLQKFFLTPKIFCEWRNRYQSQRNEKHFQGNYLRMIN